MRDSQTQAQGADPSPQEQPQNEVPSQASGSTLSSMRAEIEEPKSSPPSSTTARQTDINPLALRPVQLIQPKYLKSEAEAQIEEPSITEQVTQETKNTSKGFILGYFTRSGSTKNAPPEKEVPFESVKPDEIAAYNFEAEAKILAEAKAKRSNKGYPVSFNRERYFQRGRGGTGEIEYRGDGEGKVGRARVLTSHIIERLSDNEQLKPSVELAKIFSTFSDVKLGKRSIEHISKAEGNQAVK